MKFHVVTGLPRSGTTLLCNILNQNSRFYASSTSPLPHFLCGLVHSWSSSTEVKGLLQSRKEETEQRIQDTATGLIDNWYRCKDKEVIFDKSRLWSCNALMLNNISPKAKIIVCVRNLVDIFASVEKQHRRNPLLDDTELPGDKAIYNRADNMFGSDGLIGGPIVGIEDLIRRDPDNVIYIMYEALVKQPAMIFERLYSELKEDPFIHDFDNVKNVSEDPDGFYLYKYPHKGCGKVEPSDPDEWKKYVSPDLSSTINARFPDYCKYFNYIA